MLSVFDRTVKSLCSVVVFLSLVLQRSNQLPTVQPDRLFADDVTNRPVTRLVNTDPPSSSVTSQQLQQHIAAVKSRITSSANLSLTSGPRTLVQTRPTTAEQRVTTTVQHDRDVVGENVRKGVESEHTEELYDEEGEKDNTSNEYNYDEDDYYSNEDLLRFDYNVRRTYNYSSESDDFMWRMMPSGGSSYNKSEPINTSLLVIYSWLALVVLMIIITVVVIKYKPQLTYGCQKVQDFMLCRRRRTPGVEEVNTLLTHPLV